MKHAVYRCGGRLVVGYVVPGTDVLSAVSDYPLAALQTATIDASRRTRDTHAAPWVPPADRVPRRDFHEPLPWQTGAQMPLV